MKLSQYRYEFSQDMIAKYPTENRDDARLMVVDRKTGEIEHRIFKDIIEYFDEKDMFVFNDTKVFPARLHGNKEKTGADIEIFLLRELNRELRLWDVLVDPARKIRIGNKLYFGEDDVMGAEVIDNTTSHALLEASAQTHGDTWHRLHLHHAARGSGQLPPCRRRGSVEAQDGLRAVHHNRAGGRGGQCRQARRT